MNRRFALLFVAVFLAPCSSSLAAGWVDSWLSSKIEASPGYFQGQTRGYYSVGSLSARWPSSADYPFTVELPRFKVGCGGIDVFMGGFSFLDFDYLVDKFQNILSSAPAAAFDLALQALSPQAAQTIKDLEALADRLNSIQLDDCKTAQAVVTMGAEAFQGNEQGLTSSVQEYMTESGISDFYQSTKETISDAKGSVNSGNADLNASVSGIAEGCPDELKSLMGNDSVFEAIGVDKLGLNSDFVSFARGFIGDISIGSGSDGYVVSVEPPCPQNDGKRLEAMLDGDVWAMDSSFVCAKIGDANGDIRDFVYSRMEEIADRLRDSLPLTPAQEAFVDQTPLPLLHAMRAAVGTGQEAAVIASLSDLAAKAYALELLADVYRRAEIMIDAAESLLETQRGAKPGQPAYACSLDFATGAISTDLKALRQRIRESYSGLQRSYAGSAQELNSLYQVVEHLRRMDESAAGDSSSRLGQSASNRKDSK